MKTTDKIAVRRYRMGCFVFYPACGKIVIGLDVNGASSPILAVQIC
jgi:hypothetical protein